MIDLLYHATLYYEVCKYIQELDSKVLKYELVLEKAKAHERNCHEYKDHQASHGGANSTPFYNSPLLSAHAIAKCRPSGCGSCHLCGKTHEQGNCPAYGKICGKCKGTNHFKAVCHSKGTTKGMASPFKKQQPQHQQQRRTSMGSNSGSSGRQPFSKKMPKKQPKQRAYGVTFKNSVPSEAEATSGGGNSKVLEILVLLGPNTEGTYNRFSCFAVNSKLGVSLRGCTLILIQSTGLKL